MSLGEELQAKLNIDPVWEFSVGGIDIPVTKGVITTWGIMLFLVVVSIIFTRNMKIVPGKKQAMIEFAVEKLYNVFYNILGEHGKRYIPYLLTVLLYLGIANVIGLIGIAPPTKELNTTAALALMSIILIQYSGIRRRGFAGWLKHFAYPTGIMVPMNIMEVFIKPLSLCMRLFGNILGAYIIMELIICIIPAVVPLIFSAYFDIFDGLLQAYVFCFLTALFMQEAMGEEEE